MRKGRAELHLSRETVRRLKVWLDNAKISEGQLFRRLVGGVQIGGVLNPGSIAPIFKRVAQWIGMVLDQYKESKPRDAAIRAKYGSYQFDAYKEKMIDLILRVVSVSVDTTTIIAEMGMLQRSQLGVVCVEDIAAA
jgi:hypothetical protein